ncbi:MAG: M28 family peptidase, partial [Rickettsiales bacterium]
NSSVDVTKYIGELSDKYSFAKSITSRGTGGSDHASFYNKKIPIAFLHTGGHNYYHTPEDTPEKLNYDGIEKISKYALELIWKVSQEDKTPVFNHNNFSSNYDATQTKVIGGNMVKVCSWYDNEWAFSVRMLDVAKYLKI